MKSELTYKYSYLANTKISRNFTVVCKLYYTQIRTDCFYPAKFSFADMRETFQSGSFIIILFLFFTEMSHEEPQAMIFLHGIWRHIKEFGIERQIPRTSSPVKLEKRC